MARAIVVGSSRKPRRSAAFTATTHSSVSAPTFTMKLEASVERVNAAIVATRNEWNGSRKFDELPQFSGVRAS